MAYNYAEKNTGLYDQKLSQGLLTQPLETPSVNWVDAQSFKVTTIETSGYKAHTRNKGYNAGTMTNPKEIYTLGFDRDIEFFVDKADVDETNRDLEAARISRNFIEEKAHPEVDAYRFSKLAQFAVSNNHNISESIDPGNVYSRLKATILPIRKYGPQGIIGYLSSETMDALERSKEFNRNITNQNVGMTVLESRVTSIDGVTLIEVWDDARFGTKFDFTDGFKLATDGKKMNFLFAAKAPVICKAKISSIYFFAPGEHSQGDGWLYQNRMYHDLWVLKKQKDAVGVSIAV